MMPLQRLFWIAFLGVCGVFARYLAGLLCQRSWGDGFPFGTLLVNLTGSFVIGIVYVMATEHKLVSDDFRIGLIVGFLGGFTTFSSYAIESLHLFEQSRPLHALFYLLGSPFLGLLAAFGGVWMARGAGAVFHLIGMPK